MEKEHTIRGKVVKVELYKDMVKEVEVCFSKNKENIMLLHRVRQNDHPLYLYGKWQVLQILVVRIPCTYAVTSGSHSDLIGRKKS